MKLTAPKLRIHPKNLIVKIHLKRPRSTQLFQIERNLNAKSPAKKERAENIYEMSREKYREKIVEKRTSGVLKARWITLAK